LKRDILLTDKSKECINLTLWGDFYETMDFSKQLPVIIRKGVISEYSGNKYIKCGQTTTIWFDPDIAIAVELNKWFTICARVYWCEYMTSNGFPREVMNIT
jgi:hypothetical protein